MTTRMRPIWMGLLGLVLALGLAACGTAGGDGGGNGDGNGDGNGGSGTTSDVGMVTVNESSDGGTTSYDFAGMFLADVGFLPDDIDAIYSSVIGTCFVDPDAGDGLPTPPSDPNNPGGGGTTGVTFLSAGDQLEFTAGGSTFLTLDKFEATFSGTTIIFYEMDDATTVTSVPAGLTVSASGDDFPAFSGVAMPSATAPNAPVVGDSVTGSTTFNWTQGSSGDYGMLLVDIEGTGSHDGTSVDCILNDASESFALSSVSDLPSGFTGEVSSVVRQAVSFEAVGTDAQLMLIANADATF